MPIRDPEKRREYHREYMRQRYATDAEHVKKHAARVRARRTVPATGQPCGKCGGPDAQRHHHDYSRPDEVEWLCRACHVNEHASGKVEVACVTCGTTFARLVKYEEHRVAKGHAGPFCSRRCVRLGRTAGNCKLTDALVRELRQRHLEGAALKKLAREYGFDRSTVRNAVRRITYKHVT